MNDEWRQARGTNRDASSPTVDLRKSPSLQDEATIANTVREPASGRDQFGRLDGPTVGNPTRVNLAKESPPVDRTLVAPTVVRPPSAPTAVNQYAPPVQYGSTMAAPTQYAGYQTGYPQPPYPGPPPSNGGRSRILAIAAVVVAVVAIGAIGVVVMVKSDGSSSMDADAGARDGRSISSGDGPITRCAEPPTMVANGFRKEGSQLVVTVEVNGACAGGDIMSSDAMRIAVTESGGNVAAAMFDFSGSPVLLPDSDDIPVELDLCFNAPDYWRLPGGLVPARTDVLVENLGRPGGPREADPADMRDFAGRICPSASALPASGDSESASLNGLEQLRAEDADRIRSRAAGKWVPQVSTKRPGIFYDGIAWNYAQILGEQYYFRERFPETALLWTGDWRSYNDPNWWGTVVLIPFDRPEGALGWCIAQGMDKDHCFAKLVTNPTSAGSTEYQR